MSALIASVLCFLSLPAIDPPAPRVEVTPVLHTGDPAPGVPEATIAYLLTPQIDGAGKVLIDGYYTQPGSPLGRNALWYGSAGHLALVAAPGMQAPDLPTGVVFKTSGETFGDVWLSESGWIGYGAFLQGPGIVQGYNHLANFAGPPGDIRKVLQGGDPAPQLEPGTIIDVSDGFGLTPWLSDNGTMLVSAWLAGPSITEQNDQAIWIGPRDDLRLVWRKGMEAPGTNGARFAWQDFIKFNDARQVTFRGGLVREGSVDFTNDVGIWHGTQEGLQLLAREGEQAFALPQGVLYGGANPPAMNARGDVSFDAILRGVGVTPENDHGLWIWLDNGVHLVGRTGDLVDPVGDGVTLAHIGAPYVTAARTQRYYAKYTGIGITPANQWAAYEGPYHNCIKSLRDGQQAPRLDANVTLARVGNIASGSASSDVGGVIVTTEVEGPTVTSETKVVIWLYDYARRGWYPLLRSGTEVLGRVLLFMNDTDAYGAFCEQTGGSDGSQQSMTDSGIAATRLKFNDNTHGVYLVQLSGVGDADEDGDVDILDYRVFVNCAGGVVGLPLAEECTVFDADWDEDVDILDFRVFQIVFSGNP